MKFPRSLLPLVVLALLFGPVSGVTPAHAAALPNPGSVGVHAGPAIMGDGGGAQVDLGLNASYVVSDPFFVAGDFSWVNQGSIQSSGSTTSGSLYLLDASLNLDTTGVIPGSFAGVAIGLQFNHTSVTAGSAGASNTDTGFIVGPRVGYDYALSPSFTLGGEANWFITTASNSPNVLEVVAVLKLWL